jgi:hypothetical protein
MSDPPDEQTQVPAAEAAPGRAASGRPWIVVAAQATLLVVLAAWLLGGLPLGIPGQWAWEVRSKPLNVVALLRAVLVGAAITGVCWLGLARLRRRRRSVAAVVAGLALLVFVFQLAIASLAPQAGFYLVAGTGSSVATEYFGAAKGVRDPWAFCRAYAATQPLGHHVATHPPGAVLAYWVCLLAYESTPFPRRTFATGAERLIGAPRDVIAVAANSYPGTAMAPEDVGAALFCCLAFGACAALTVVPLYWLAARVARRSTALLVCCLFALAPAPVLFFQGLDALVLLLGATALALAYAAVKNQRLWAAALCGLTLGVMCAITFGATAAVLTVLGVAALLAFRLPPAQRGRAWACIAAGAGVWVAAIAALDLLCEGRLPLIFTQAMAAHRSLTFGGFRRHYSTWVWLNLVEFACFLGLPVLAALAAGVGSLARRRGRGMSEAELVGLVGLGVLLALNLSGSVRGEVGRVWMFLMPPLILWAGHWLRTTPSARRTVTAVTVVLALAQVILLGLTLTPVTLPF